MKKLGLMLLAFVTMMAGASAQENAERRGERRGPRMDKETMIARMTERQVKQLSLDEAQAEQMKVLNAEYFAQLEELMRAGRPEPNDSVAPKEMSREEQEAFRKELDAKTAAVREGYLAKVKEVLTPEQYEKFEKMEKERPRGGRPGGRPDGRRGGDRGPRGGGERGGFGDAPMGEEF